MVAIVVSAGGIQAAVAALLLAQAETPAGLAGADARELAPPVDPEPAATLEVALDQPADLSGADADVMGCELTGIELLLDGTSLSAPLLPAASGARPVFSGLVAPGPHNLVALLFFRPRAPDPARSAEPPIRLVAEHRFQSRPTRPLVLLITPARPTPACDDLPQVRFAAAPAPLAAAD